MSRPIAAVLHDLDQLAVDVPAGLADDMWSRIFEEAPAEAEAEVERRVVARLPLRLRPRRRWLLVAAAAAVIALVASAVLVLLPQPKDALAVVREARTQFRNPPPLSLVVERTVTKEALAGETAEPATADWVRVTKIDYRDDTRWRREILEDTANPFEDAQIGHLEISDGTYTGVTDLARKRLIVRPVEDREEAPGEPLEALSPALNQGPALDDESIAEDCDVAPDATVAGRRARHIRCDIPPLPAEGIPEGGKADVWLDAETGLVLRTRFPNGAGHVVRTITYDVDRADDEDLFAVRPPSGFEAEWVGPGVAPPQFAARRPLGPATTVVDPDRPREIVVTEAGEVWVSLAGGDEGDVSHGKLARLDPETGEVRDVVPVPSSEETGAEGSTRSVASAVDLTVVGDSLWVFDELAWVIHRFDLEARRFTGSPVRVGDREHQPLRFLAHDGDLWVGRVDNRPVTIGGSTAEGVLGELVRLDDTGAVAETIGLPGVPFGDALSAHGSIWVTATEYDRQTADIAGVLYRVDPAAGSVSARIPVQSPVGLAASGDSIWVTSYSGEGSGAGKVFRVDAASNAVTATVDIAGGAGSAAVAGGRLWITNVDGDSVTQVDLATNAVVGRIDVGSRPVWVEPGDGVVWVAVSGARTVVRLPT